MAVQSTYDVNIFWALVYRCQCSN